jgi:hypothetical protein
MTFINDDLIDIPIKDIFEVNRHEIILKLSRPDFSLRDSYGVYFQPVISSFNSKETYIDESIFIFPVIPQYFHNFFEIFPKLIALKNTNRKFKVILLYAEELNSKNVFYSLDRGPEYRISNSAHVKDFLDYENINYECINVSDINKVNYEQCFVFYSEVLGLPVDRTYVHNYKQYELEHFLKVPNIKVLQQSVEQLRNIFPKTNVVPYNKVFISRKKAIDRKWEYEDRLELLMLEMGYQVVLLEDMPLLDQIHLLQSAEKIVCLYGSALVNCTLLSNSHKVLAINPTKDYDIYVYSSLLEYFSIPYQEINNLDEYEDLISFLGYTIEMWEKNEK